MTSNGQNITVPARQAMPLGQTTRQDGYGNKVTNLQILVEQNPIVEEYKVVQHAPTVEKVKTLKLA